jgi:hypothetical protein
MPLRLTVALKERNINVVEERLAKTSDPTSPEYGKHMNWEELTALTGATDEQIATVSTVETIGITVYLLNYCIFGSYSYTFLAVAILVN